MKLKTLAALTTLATLWEKVKNFYSFLFSTDAYLTPTGLESKKAFKALKKRYETITLSEINEAFNNLVEEGNGSFKGQCAANVLTGFASTGKCSLCRAVNQACFDCFWVIRTGHPCTSYPNAETYKGIYFAKDALELKEAFKKRAERMGEVLG